MANDGYDGSGLQYGFLKTCQSLKVFQIFKFGSEIFEILKKCCCSTKVLQEIVLYHLVGVYQIFIP